MAGSSQKTFFLDRRIRSETRSVSEEERGSTLDRGSALTLRVTVGGASPNCSRERRDSLQTYACD